MDSLSKVLSELNTKRLYTTTTHFIHISNITTTKNRETGSNTIR